MSRSAHPRFLGVSARLPGLCVCPAETHCTLRPFVVFLENYHDLYQWSVESYSDFWAEFWKFSGIVSSRMYDQVSGQLIPCCLFLAAFRNEALMSGNPTSFPLKPLVSGSGRGHEPHAGAGPSDVSGALDHSQQLGIVLCLLKSRKMAVKYTKHKIYHLNHFQVCSSTTLQ